MGVRLGQDQAVASVLSQLDKENNFRSRKLLQVELNCTVYDKELLAIVESFKLWRQYLLYSPHKVVVKSDHNNLKILLSFGNQGHPVGRGVSSI